MPKRLHGNIEIDLRRFGLPAQSGPVHVAFDNAGRPLRAELTVPGVLWNTLTEPGHGSAKNALEAPVWRRVSAACRAGRLGRQHARGRKCAVHLISGFRCWRRRQGRTWRRGFFQILIERNVVVRSTSRLSLAVDGEGEDPNHGAVCNPCVSAPDQRVVHRRSF